MTAPRNAKMNSSGKRQSVSYETWNRTICRRSKRRASVRVVARGESSPRRRRTLPVPNGSSALSVVTATMAHQNERQRTLGGK